MIDSRDLIVWGRKNDKPRVAERCPKCRGKASISAGAAEDDCDLCGGLGWFGIDPLQPVEARPGSVEKIAMLGVRYASGVPLWNDQDGPRAEVPEHLRPARTDFVEEFCDDESLWKGLAP